LVSSTEDLVDADPLDGVCAAANGACTLRAAIMQANFSPGLDTITLPAGLYRLSRVNQDDTALGGDLDIRDPLAIQGAGIDSTVIDGNGAVTNDRVIQVLSTAGQVRLSALTIRNGRTPSTVVAGLREGGGLVAQGGPINSALDLSDVWIEDSSAALGGGIYAWSTAITLTRVTLRANTALEAGGGLWADGSILVVRDSQVYSNTAQEGGGIALPSEIYFGRIERTEIFSNTAVRGGGVASGTQSPVPLVESRLYGNYASSAGGAIYQHTFPSLVISNTVVAANASGLYGGGVMITNTSATRSMVIVASTFSGNASQYGGAIYQHAPIGVYSQLELVNSTLSGNTAAHDGGGLYAGGFARSIVFNTTLAGNYVERPVGQSYTARGGGVYLAQDASLRAENVLLADNVHMYGVTIPVADDCFTSGATTLLSYGNNLIETTTGCALSGSGAGDVTGQDPRLGPLQLNGGQTPTRALLLGSPAIDAGSEPGCPNASLVPLTADQRGFARLGGARCDIGSFEYYPPLFLALMHRGG
jgi:hypothetical protein